MATATLGITEQSRLTKKQVKVYGPVDFTYYGKPARIRATVRYDDQCGNGHNSFSITGDIWQDGRWDAGGCIHEEITRAFPELTTFIKWHLCSSDGPMHYPGNAIYHAGDHDHHGLLKGEKRQLVNGKSKLPVWERVIRDAKGEMVEVSHADWRDSDTQPQESLTATWEPVWIVGEGKERELDHARSCAVWPNATDEDLTAPGLKERLEARLPALMVEFRQAVESLGFIW